MLLVATLEECSSNPIILFYQGANYHLDSRRKSIGKKGRRRSKLYNGQRRGRSAQRRSLRPATRASNAGSGRLGERTMSPETRKRMLSRMLTCRHNQRTGKPEDLAILDI